MTVAQSRNDFTRVHCPAQQLREQAVAPRRAGARFHFASAGWRLPPDQGAGTHAPDALGAVHSRALLSNAEHMQISLFQQ